MVELTSNRESLGSVSIKSGTFQLDSLFPLLFVVSMIPLSLVLRKCEAGYTYANTTKVNQFSRYVCFTLEVRAN